jgi:two-component system invasion response regulator UvrY
VRKTVNINQIITSSVIPILETFPLINVLLVDDHELVRAGIRRISEDIKGIKVAGEACCGEDAVKWCRKTRPMWC